MNYLSYTASVALVLLLALAPSMEAQEKKRVHVRFRTCSVNEPIKGLSLVTKGGDIQVKIPGKSRSEVMIYRGARTMVFFRKSEQTENGPLVPLAKVTLKQDIKSPLLIFIKTRNREGGKVGYRIKVIEDHPQSFTNGSMKFINLTKRTLYLIAGQKDELKKVMKPGAIVSHQLPKEFKGNLPVKVALKTAKGVTPVMHSRVFPNQSVRDIYFIWPVARKQAGHQVRISTLRERGDVARMRLKPKKGGDAVKNSVSAGE